MSEIQSVPNKFNPIDRLRGFTQKKVNESSLPTEESLGYKSTVGFYGGKLRHLPNTDGQDHLVWDTTGVTSNIDRIGDAVLRRWDEHVINTPAKMIRRHPGKFLKHLVTGPMRYRGKPNEIAQNIQRLGLQDTYGLHPNGIEIKKPETFTNGIALQDIMRADEINSPQLDAIDKTQAVKAAAEYVRLVHDQHGAIGELVPSDIIFRSHENGTVGNPILNIPDEIYNPQKHFSENAKKATDLLDFLVTMQQEDLKNGGGQTNTQNLVATIIDAYGQSDVWSVVNSFAKRGRLTVNGDSVVSDKQSSTTRKLMPILGIHNKARLGYDDEVMQQLRQNIIDLTEPKVA